MRGRKRALVRRPRVRVRRLRVRRHAQVGADGDRRNVPVRQQHRGGRGLQDEIRPPGLVQDVLRHCRQEQPLLVVRHKDPVLRPTPVHEETAVFRRHPTAVRQHQREQIVHRRTTSEYRS